MKKLITQLSHFSFLLFVSCTSLLAQITDGNKIENNNNSFFADSVTKEKLKNVFHDEKERSSIDRKKGAFSLVASAIMADLIHEGQDLEEIENIFGVDRILYPFEKEGKFAMICLSGEPFMNLKKKGDEEVKSMGSYWYLTFKINKNTRIYEVSLRNVSLKQIFMKAHSDD